MLPRNRVATHPGVILLREFLTPLGQSQKGFAHYLGVPIQRINELVRGKRGVTPETAWLLSQALGTTPEFWMNLQNNHDLTLVRPTRRVRRLAPNKPINADAIGPHPHTAPSRTLNCWLRQQSAPVIGSVRRHWVQ